MPVCEVITMFNFLPATPFIYLINAIKLQTIFYKECLNLTRKLSVKLGKLSVTQDDQLREFVESCEH